MLVRSIVTSTTGIRALLALFSAWGVRLAAVLLCLAAACAKLGYNPGWAEDAAFLDSLTGAPVQRLYDRWGPAEIGRAESATGPVTLYYADRLGDGVAAADNVVVSGGVLVSSSGGGTPRVVKTVPSVIGSGVAGDDNRWPLTCPVYVALDLQQRVVDWRTADADCPARHGIESSGNGPGLADIAE